MIRKFGLNAFQLKIIAALLMLLDHIHQFFGFTGQIPYFFTQLGRLSAPIFLFLLVEGFFKTRNRFKYFLKIYLIAGGMVLVRLFILKAKLYTNYNDLPFNGILSSFAILIALMQGIEWIKQKKLFAGIAAITATVILPYLGAELIRIFNLYEPVFFHLLEAVYPMHTLVMDGGTFILLCGIVLYLFHGKPLLQAVMFILAGNAYYYFTLTSYVGNITISELFNPYCQWMMSFAVIFFLLYNKEHGKITKPRKAFFYTFYPLHIYILYFGAYLLKLYL